MGQVEVKRKIHSVSNDNLISLYEIRRSYIRKSFDKVLPYAKNMTILVENEEGQKYLFTTLEAPELVYSLQNSIHSVFNDRRICTSK